MASLSLKFYHLPYSISTTNYGLCSSKFIIPFKCSNPNRRPLAISSSLDDAAASASVSAGDNTSSNFCIIEGPETGQDFVQMQSNEIQDNIRSRRNKIFLLMEEVRRLRVQQRLKNIKPSESGFEDNNEMPDIPSSIPFLPLVTPKTLKQLYLTSFSFVSGIIVFGGLLAPMLELKLGLGGTSYKDFISNMHLPLQLSQVDPIVASFSGGAVGVISTLMLLEANNVKQQEKKRCRYCHGTGYLACARCSSSGECLNIGTISVSNVSDRPLRAPTTRRCLSCSGAGKETRKGKAVAENEQFLEELNKKLEKLSIGGEKLHKPKGPYYVIKVPSRVSTGSRLDGSLSLRFAGYKAVRETGESSRQANQDNEDEESMMREMAAVAILERFIDFDLLRSLHFMKPALPVEIREEIYKRVGVETRDPLIDAAIDDWEDEELKDRWNNKKKNHKKKGNWDTLGQSSGKYDYYVNYNYKETSQKEEIVAAGWGEEFHDPQEPTFGSNNPIDTEECQVKWDDYSADDEESDEDSIENQWWYQNDNLKEMVELPYPSYKEKEVREEILVIQDELLEMEYPLLTTVMEEWAFVIISEEVLSEEVYVTTIKESSWRPKVELPEDQELCYHKWKKEKPKEKENCKLCKSDVRQNIRGKFEVCDLIVCMLCLKAYYDEVIKISPKPPISSTKELVNELMKHCMVLQQEVDRLGQIIQDDEKIMLERERLQLEETEVPEEVQEETIALTQSTQQNPRTERRNKLYNLKVYFKIPGVEEFEIPAIIDTGATSCCINEEAIPIKAMEPSPYIVKYSGINSEQLTRKKLKDGIMKIENNSFRIPFTFCFPMKLGGGVQMLLGCNFIISMGGGIRFEGSQVTFYKTVTTINTSLEAANYAIQELELEEEEYIKLQEEYAAYNLGRLENTSEGIQEILHELEKQGFIGEDPLKHWKKNKVTCKLDIINPEMTIQDKPLKQGEIIQEENGEVMGLDPLITWMKQYGNGKPKELILPTSEDRRPKQRWAYRATGYGGPLLKIQYYASVLENGEYVTRDTFPTIIVCQESKSKGVHQYRDFSNHNPPLSRL
ncbi:hypothetical protein E3N88_11136 [Mikania micrantha]|uniref:Retropepsins domain-containing protein n=1 Tax=Mikania micrantha TaxID=192012 RepID=A0A5N6PCP0_9ASTR|nr:hypothetical protein E3N88_11136 [Mikania micrantha]